MRYGFDLKNLRSSHATGYVHHTYCAVHWLDLFSRSAVKFSSRRGINFCFDYPLDLLRFSTFILDLLKPSEIDALDRVRDTVARPDGDGAGQISRQSVEQDHRFIKRRMITLLRFKSFQPAASTIAGIKLVTVIRKGQFLASLVLSSSSVILLPESGRGRRSLRHAVRFATDPGRRHPSGRPHPGGTVAHGDEPPESCRLGRARR